MKAKEFIAIGLACIFLFLLGVILLDPWISDVSLAVDTGASHYYWKLPERNTITMVIVWSLFAIQLLLNYLLIMRRMRKKKYGLLKENYQLLGMNMFFLFIHLFQSLIFYDGLAQDVSVFSSQGSVIFVLVTMILMLNNRRGFIFGLRLPISERELKPIYALHGFVFTFSIVYTFWYHPAVNTIGHLFGFLYLSLFFIQISLLKTKEHVNLKWLALLEVIVVFHAMSVAYFVQNSELWAMFGFGFSFIFFFTQVYGLNLNKKIIYSLQIIFVALAIIYYAITDISNIHQVLWIPIIEYLGAFALFVLVKSYNLLKNQHSKK